MPRRLATILNETIVAGIIDSDFAAGDVGGDCQNRHAIALAVEQAVDQMKVAWTAAPGTYRKAPGKMSFSSRCKCSGLFMTHVNPVDRLSSPQRVCQAIERVANDSLDTLHARFFKSFDQILGCNFAHQLFLTHRKDVPPAEGLRGTRTPQRPSRRSEGLDASPLRQEQ